MLVLIKIAYCNIHTTNTEKVRGPKKFFPRACSWTTLVYEIRPIWRERKKQNFQKQLVRQNAENSIT